MNRLRQTVKGRTGGGVLGGGFGMLGLGGGVLGQGFGTLGKGFGTLGKGFGLLGKGGGLLGLSEKTRRFMRQALQDAADYVQAFDQSAKEAGEAQGITVTSRGTSDRDLADVREQVSGRTVVGVSLKPAGTRLRKLKGIQDTAEGVDWKAKIQPPPPPPDDQQQATFVRLDAATGRPVVQIDGQEQITTWTIGNTTMAPGQSVLVTTINGQSVMETPEQAKQRMQKPQAPQRLGPTVPEALASISVPWMEVRRLVEPAIAWLGQQSTTAANVITTTIHLISGSGAASAVVRTFTSTTAEYLWANNPYSAHRPFTPTYNSAWTAWNHAGSTWTRYRWCSQIDISFSDFDTTRSVGGEQVVPGANGELLLLSYNQTKRIRDWAHFRLVGSYNGSSGFGGGSGAPEIYLEMTVTGTSGEDPNTLIGLSARNPRLQIVANNSVTITCEDHTTETDDVDHIAAHRAGVSTVTVATPDDTTALQSVMASVFGELGEAVSVNIGPFPITGSPFFQLYSYGTASLRGLTFDGTVFEYRLTGSAISNAGLAPTNRTVMLPPSPPGITDAAQILNNTPAGCYGISSFFDDPVGSSPFYRYAGMLDCDYRRATPSVFPILNGTHGFTESDVYSNGILSDFYALMGSKPAGYALDMIEYETNGGVVSYPSYWGEATTVNVLRFADVPENYRTSSDAYYDDYGDSDNPEGRPSVVGTPAVLPLTMLPLASRVLGPSVEGMGEPQMLYATAFDEAEYVAARLTALGITP